MSHLRHLVPGDGDGRGREEDGLEGAELADGRRRRQRRQARRVRLKERNDILSRFPMQHILFVPNEKLDLSYTLCRVTQPCLRPLSHVSQRYY